MYAIKLNENNNPILMGLTTIPAKNKIKAENSLQESIIGLDHIYRQVPTTSCNRCGSCCDGTKTGNPLTYSVEYWNIIRFLSSSSNKDLRTRIFGASLMVKALLDKKAGQEPNVKEGTGHLVSFCPAIDPQTQLCLVYEYRPLVCRVYGLGRWYKNKKQDWDNYAEEDNVKRSECDQVEIDDIDNTELWSRGSNRLLFDRLARLSVYYYVDEVKDAIFNANSMAEWLSLAN